MTEKSQLFFGSFLQNKVLPYFATLRYIAKTKIKRFMQPHVIAET